MPNRSYSARGRQSGAASRSVSWSNSSSAVWAEGRSRMPNTWTSSSSSQYRDGVPRNAQKWLQNVRQISRGEADPTGLPGGTPSWSNGTPWACSNRVT